MAYYKKFRTEEVYLWNNFEDCFVRSTPGQGYFAKFSGGHEFPVAANSDMVVDAVDGMIEVTKEQYEKCKAPSIPSEQWRNAMGFSVATNPYAQEDGTPEEGKELEFFYWASVQEMKRINALPPAEKKRALASRENLAKKMNS